MAKIVEFKRRERRLREIQIDALFQCLPAPSHKIIAQRMSKELGHAFPITHVGSLLNHLRKNKDSFEWTIAHASRGPASGADRFHAVLMEKGRDPQFDPSARHQLQLGAISDIATTYTLLKNEASALQAAQQYVPATLRRKLASLRRRIEFFAEEMGELLEDYREANGA